MWSIQCVFTRTDSRLSNLVNWILCLLTWGKCRLGNCNVTPRHGDSNISALRTATSVTVLLNTVARRQTIHRCTDATLSKVSAHLSAVPSLASWPWQRRSYLNGSYAPATPSTTTRYNHPVQSQTRTWPQSKYAACRHRWKAKTRDFAPYKLAQASPVRAIINRPPTFCVGEVPSGKTIFGKGRLTRTHHMPRAGHIFRLYLHLLKLPGLCS